MEIECQPSTQGFLSKFGGYTNMFSGKNFCSGSATALSPHKIELFHDEKPRSIRADKYSHTQKQFLAEFVNQLLDTGIVFTNSFFPLASAPFLVPKQGSQYRFKDDLRPVDKFASKQQYPIHIIENGLTKLSGSQLFTGFGISDGPW